MRNFFKRIFNKLTISFLLIIITLFSATACSITFGEKKQTKLEFTLTQSQVDSYVETANTAAASLSSSTANIFTATSHVNNLANGLYYINEQYLIAEIEFFKDMSVTESKANYEFAVKAANTARTSYKNALKMVWNSNTPIKDTLFDGFSEIEANALFNTSSEVSNLELEISTLSAEHLTLSDSEFNEKTGEIYAKIVTNYNKIATLSSFENYYVYSSGYIYERDYTAESCETLLNLIKTYIIPLYIECYQQLRLTQQNLTNEEKAIFNNFTNKSFREQHENYVINYVNSLPNAMKRGMYDMFERNNYYVATNDNAYKAAFTVSLNYSGIPYCYFGPSYQNCFTIIHELGHYYADYSNPLTNIPLDIAETHSQSNELLFLHYLRNDFTKNVYDAIKLNEILNMLKACITSSLINSFEMKVFSKNVENYKSSDFDAIMTGIINEIGSDFFANYLNGDFYSYWKRVCIQQPCYYVSYAVSGVTALALYAQAIQSDNDYLNALERYNDLCTANFDKGLSATLDEVDMLDPFSVSTYTTIYNALSPTKTA